MRRRGGSMRRCGAQCGDVVVQYGDVVAQGGDVVAQAELWWLNGSALDSLGSSPGVESGMILVRCRVIVHTVKFQGRAGNLHLTKRKIFKGTVSRDF